MPLANFKVLVRPNPGGLEDHQKYVTNQADDLLKKERFADLIITSEDGTSIQCHQALVGESILNFLGQLTLRSQI